VSEDVTDATIYTVNAAVTVTGKARAKQIETLLNLVLARELANVTIEQYVDEHACEHRWRDYSEYGGDFLRGEVCRDCGAVRADVEADGEGR